MIRDSKVFTGEVSVHQWTDKGCAAWYRYTVIKEAALGFSSDPDNLISQDSGNRFEISRYFFNKTFNFLVTITITSANPSSKPPSSFTKDNSGLDKHSPTKSDVWNSETRYSTLCSHKQQQSTEMSIAVMRVSEFNSSSWRQLSSGQRAADCRGTWWNVKRVHWKTVYCSRSRELVHSFIKRMFDNRCWEHFWSIAVLSIWLWLFYYGQDFLWADQMFYGKFWLHIDPLNKSVNGLSILNSVEIHYFIYGPDNQSGIHFHCS